VPYLEVTEFNNTLPIKAVIVGPHPNQKMQQDALEMLFEATGLDAEIRLSEIPFLSTRVSG
jgi:hypothetical protein